MPVESVRALSAGTFVAIYFLSMLRRIHFHLAQDLSIENASFQGGLDRPQNKSVTRDRKTIIRERKGQPREIKGAIRECKASTAG